MGAARIRRAIANSSATSIAYGNGRYVAVGLAYTNPNTDIVAVLATPNAPPIILTGPASRTVVEGARATFTVTLENPNTATSFQWRRHGVALTGATTASYTVARATFADAGRLTVDIRNDLGSTTSDPAEFVVLPVRHLGRIVNLSVLTTLDRADERVTVGFVVGGAGTSGTKPLLVRAGGPSLASFGVARPHPDPKLDLWAAGIGLFQNDNWAGDAMTNSTIAQVGAFAFLAPDSRDAALATSVQKGDSGLIVSGNGGGTGAVIAEVYDATPASAFSATTPRLVNVSVLKDLAPGASLSAGFVIGGATEKTVLIRAVGPGLSNYVAGARTANPALSLYRSGTAASIAANQGWDSSDEMAGTFASVGAFALPRRSSDAALLATLLPGNYTAVVTQTSGSAGFVLVEVYELP